jgi:hypothetical protein
MGFLAIEPQETSLDCAYTTVQHAHYGFSFHLLWVAIVGQGLALAAESRGIALHPVAGLRPLHWCNSPGTPTPA